MEEAALEPRRAKASILATGTLGSLTNEGGRQPQSWHHFTALANVSWHISSVPGALLST